MQELVKRTTVRELVLAFEEAEATVRSSFAAIVAAEQKLNAVFTLGGDMPIRIEATGRAYGGDRFNEPGECIARMARSAWRVIVDRLELRRVMSVERWEALQKRLENEREELPPITEENVLAFARFYGGSLDAMFAEAVGEVFDWLRPRKGTYGEKYKTNDAYEVRAKVILPWMVERDSFRKGGFRMKDHREQRLMALENVFNALDGRGMANKGHYSAIERAIKESPDGRAETDLFRVRCCANSNLHIEFKRLDLLAEFNRRAGGLRLKPDGGR